MLRSPVSERWSKEGATDMAVLKETQITDRRFELTIDDNDPTIWVAFASATTRDNDGNVVRTYRQDISDMLTAERRQILGPLLQNVVGRIMQERGITTDDLAEGNAAAQARREALEEEQRRQLEQTKAEMEEAAETLRVEQAAIFEQEEQQARERHRQEGIPLVEEKPREEALTAEQMLEIMERERLQSQLAE